MILATEGTEFKEVYSFFSVANYSLWVWRWVMSGR